MPSRIQSTYTGSPRHTIACMGDSLTNNWAYGVPYDLMWPGVLASSLNSLGCHVKARNFGRSGNTTTQMITRWSWMNYFDVPSLGIIFGSVNDPPNSIAGATTQANLTTMINSLLSMSVPMILVLNTQYINWSTAGDTLSTPGATNATLRTYQAAAVSAINLANVVYVDLYTYMRSIIANATVVALPAISYTSNATVAYAATVPGSGISYTVGANVDSTPSVISGITYSWHIAALNQHLNILGNYVVAQCVLSAIQAQTGWITALT